MSIESISFAIEFILDEELPELVKCWPVPPDQIDTVLLPASYVLTGAGNRTSGDSVSSETRTYRVQFPILAKGAVTPMLRETRCRPLLLRALAVLDAFPTLRHKNMLGDQHPIGIQSAFVRGDSGIVVLPEYGGRFVGF